MRDIFKFALLAAGAGLVVWLAAGFVVIDWNVWAWAEGSRASLVCSAVILACVGMAATA